MTMHIEFESPELMYVLDGLPKVIQMKMYQDYKAAEAKRKAWKEQEREKRNARDRARYAKKKEELNDRKTNRRVG